VFVAAAGEFALAPAFQLLQELRSDQSLRARGIIAEGGFFEKKLGAQLAIAHRLAATHCVIVGEEELAQGEVTLRDLQTSSQLRLPRRQLIAHLTKSIPRA
jgi:histidyl-tRNA synthetase